MTILEAAAVMDLQVALGVIAGVVATLTTAILNQADWPDNRKRLVAGIVTAVYGVIAAVVSGSIVGFPAEWAAMLGKIVIFIAGAIVVAQGLYAQFKPLLQNLTEKTTIQAKHLEEGDG